MSSWKVPNTIGFTNYIPRTRTINQGDLIMIVSNRTQCSSLGPTPILAVFDRLEDVALSYPGKYAKRCRSCIYFQGNPARLSFPLRTFSDIGFYLSYVAKISRDKESILSELSKTSANPKVKKFIEGLKKPYSLTSGDFYRFNQLS